MAIANDDNTNTFVLLARGSCSISIFWMLWFASSEECAMLVLNGACSILACNLLLYVVRIICTHKPQQQQTRGGYRQNMRMCACVRVCVLCVRVYVCTYPRVYAVGAHVHIRTFSTDLATSSSALACNVPA